MNWTVFDFIFAGVLLGSVGTAMALVFWKARSLAYRGAAIAALFGGLVLVWVNGAVGIIGSEANDANLMFGGIPVILLGGAILARLRARGMMWTLAAAAAAQLLIGIVALAGNLGTGGSSWPLDLIGATAIFTLIWLTSAWLFRAAARSQSRAADAVTG